MYLTPDDPLILTHLFQLAFSEQLQSGTLASPGKTTNRIFNEIILKRFLF
jgi:hypothetical protein